MIGAILRDETGLPPFAMATGSRGYYVVVPLQRRHDHDEVRAFTRDLGRLAVVRETAQADAGAAQSQPRRGGPEVDIQRNAYAHTAVAPYSVRALPAATCAAPLHWEELEGPPHETGPLLDPLPLPARLARDGDPWEAIARPPARARRRPQNARRTAGGGGDRAGVARRPAGGLRRAGLTRAGARGGATWTAATLRQQRRQSAARAEAELAVDRAEVVLDRLAAEEEGGADLAVGAALGDEQGDLQLVRGQFVDR